MQGVKSRIKFNIIARRLVYNNGYIPIKNRRLDAS